MQQYIVNYIEVYEDLRKHLKWKVSDKKILMTIASFYAMNGRTFHLEHYLDLAENIKKRANFFSFIRSESRYIAAAMIDVNFEAPEGKIPVLFDTYDQLVQEKFKRGIFTYIAASVLIKYTSTDDCHSIIRKAKNIYEDMKSGHRFLTTAEDYPLAVLLAIEGEKNIIAQSEVYYDQLSNSGFRKGNHLQMLSHILTLGKEVSAEIMINRTIKILDFFKELGIRNKTLYYPAIGILAMLPPDELNMMKVFEAYTELNNTGPFKRQKDLNLTLAASFFVKDKLENSGFIETSLYTTLETILQAQQAATTAAIVAASTASSSSGN